MSNKRRGDEDEDKEDPNRDWLQRRVEATRLLLENMAKVRKGMTEKGPKNAKRPPAARPNAQPPDPPPPVHPGSGFEDQAKVLIMTGDDRALKELVRTADYADVENERLLELATEKGQVECLYVLLQKIRELEVDGNFVNHLSSLLDTAAWLDHPVPRVIHLLAAWIYDIDPVYSEPEQLLEFLEREDEYGARLSYRPACEANAIAVATWLLDEDGALPDEVPSFLESTIFPRARLLVDWVVVALTQTVIGYSPRSIRFGDVGSVACFDQDGVLVVQFHDDVDKVMDMFALEATESFAEVKGSDEVVLQTFKGPSYVTRSGKPMTRPTLTLAVPKAMDIKMNAVSSTDDATVFSMNYSRDMLLPLAGDANVALVLQGLFAASITDAQRQYVLDGSKWYPPSEMDLHGALVRGLPAAVIVVSVDTGSVVGYLSYVDKKHANGEFEALTADFVHDIQNELKTRNRPFGLPNFHSYPVEDPAAQVFYADVRDKGIIGIVNCGLVLIHYVSDERVWDKSLSIVPFDKRKHQ